MTRRRRFAEGTDVSVERSQAELAGILRKAGVLRQAWASEPEGDTLQFELAGHSYRIRIVRPDAEALHDQWRADDATPSQLKYLPTDTQVQAEWRRRWRATVLLLKAKLEYAEGDESSVIRELMPYALLKDGRTLEESIAAGGVPLLVAGGGR